MTEHRSFSLRHGRGGTGSPRPDTGHADTLPVSPPVLATPEEPTILGFPADAPGEGSGLDRGPGPADPSAQVVGADGAPPALRTPDPAAGALLLVAGAAGLLSLFLPWLRHGEQLGLTVVERGLRSAGAGELVRSGLVLPTAVAVGGGVLFLLGLLAFRPARSHRALGVIALSVALAVAGIVVRLADLGWAALLSDPGVLCAVVLAGLGLLGALKAMLTLPRVDIDPS